MTTMPIAPKLPMRITVALFATIVATAPVVAQTAAPYPIAQPRPTIVTPAPPAPVTYRWIAPSQPVAAEVVPVPPRAPKCRGLACPGYIMLGTAY
jgi:hypothetical protein